MRRRLGGPVSELAFEVRDIAYRYNQVPALRGLSIDIRKGEPTP